MEDIEGSVLQGRALEAPLLRPVEPVLSEAEAGIAIIAQRVQRWGKEGEKESVP